MKFVLEIDPDLMECVYEDSLYSGLSKSKVIRDIIGKHYGKPSLMGFRQIAHSKMVEGFGWVWLKPGQTVHEYNCTYCHYRLCRPEPFPEGVPPKCTDCIPGNMKMIMEKRP